MKTAELTGALLDYWVAKAEGIPLSRIDGSRCYARQRKQEDWKIYEPSYSWLVAGPIIGRERIMFAEDGVTQMIVAECRGSEEVGPTHRIAAMRAYVASKFGDTVPDTL